MATTFQHVKDSWSSALASGITDVATEMTLEAGAGATLPSTPCKVSIESEIVKITNVVTDTCTIERAQDDTAAAAHAADSIVSLNTLASHITDLNTAVNAIENAKGAALGYATLDASSQVVETPKDHATRHESGGDDEILLDDLGAPEDNTDLDVSTSAHGLCPKGVNDTTKFLRSDCEWKVPPAGGGGGDMAQSVYDTDADGNVDAAETVDDGDGNSSTAAEVADAVTKAHTQLCEAADFTKLDTIEENADVTDAANIASSIVGCDAKETPVNADSFGIIDSEESNVLKELTFTQLKAFLKTYFDTLYSSGFDTLVSVTMRANQFVGVGTQTLQFNTEAIDNNSEWNTTTYKFVPATNGWYVFSVRVYCMNFPDWCYVGVAIDGTSHSGQIAQRGVRDNIDDDAAVSYTSPPIYITTAQKVTFYMKTGTNATVDKDHTYAGVFRVR